MPRITWSLVLGLVLPIALLFVNLILGYGGILAFIVLLVWIGAAVILVYPEETQA